MKDFLDTSSKLFLVFIHKKRPKPLQHISCICCTDFDMSNDFENTFYTEEKIPSTFN